MRDGIQMKEQEVVEAYEREIRQLSGKMVVNLRGYAINE